MSKLKGTDTMMDIAVKMSDGNPGAISAIMGMIEDIENTFHHVLFLDTIEIYGSRLYKLWSDCCQRDNNKMLKVVDNVMIGKMTKEELYNKIDQPYGENIEQ